jgi:hypothetical protein
MAVGIKQRLEEQFRLRSDSLDQTAGGGPVPEDRAGDMCAVASRICGVVRTSARDLSDYSPVKVWMLASRRVTLAASSCSRQGSISGPLR